MLYLLELLEIVKGKKKYNYLISFSYISSIPSPIASCICC